MPRAAAMALAAMLALSSVAAWNEAAEVLMAADDKPTGMIVGNSVPINNGTWNLCEPHSMSFTRRNAPYVSLHFARFKLMDGDVLTLENGNGTERREIKPAPGVTQFSTERIVGPTAVVTFSPAGCKRAVDQQQPLPADFGFDITALEYTYEQTVRKEDVCGANNQNEAAVCFKNRDGVSAEVYRKSLAVARLIQSSQGPQTACTGWLLGSEGHLVTNQHCIKNAADANRTNFEFMVQSPQCDKSCRQLGDCRQFGTVESIGADFVYANEKLDFAVVKLRKKPCVLTGKYGFLSLRRQEPRVKEPIYLVHHPSGGGKAITTTQDIDNADDDPTTGDSGTTQAVVAEVNDENNLGDFWTSYYADTERGSSGTPVLSMESHHVIAVHSNGACKNSGAPSHLIIKNLQENKVELPADAFA
ncbi:hypothetical protein PINS_up011486 [Pythium insidiosum]|nr:hypothetical protein PINS_up011486 [Pythium insidiosum]